MARLRIELTIVYDLEVPDEEWAGEHPICPIPWPTCDDCQKDWNPLSDYPFNDPHASYVEAGLEAIRVGHDYCLSPYVGADGELLCNCQPESNCPVRRRREDV